MILAGREVRTTVAEVVVCPFESVVVIETVTSILDCVSDERERILPVDRCTTEDDTIVLPALLVMLSKEIDPRKTSGSPSEFISVIVEKPRGMLWATFQPSKGKFPAL